LARPAVLPPSIDALLSSERGRALAGKHGRLRVRELLREAAARLRSGTPEPCADPAETLLSGVESALAARPPPGRAPS
jgi:Selenocysteine synthase N terminal.